MLARFCLNCLDLCLRPFYRKQLSVNTLTRYIHWNSQAALVAVDMLALAILLKGMGMLETSFNRGMICVIVFVVVWFCTSMLANYSGKKFSLMENSQISGQANFLKHWLLLNFRLLEPLFIFYFLLQLLVFLWLGEFMHGVNFLIGAAILLLLLIKNVSLEKIASAATANYIENSGDENSVRQCWQVVSDNSLIVLKLFSLLIIAVFFVLYFVFIKWSMDFLGFSQQDIIKFEMIISSGLATLLLIGNLIYGFSWHPYMVRFNSFLNGLYKKLAHCSNFLFVSCIAILLSILIPWADSFSWKTHLDDANRQTHVIQFLVWTVCLLVLSLFSIFTRGRLFKLIKQKKLTRSQIKSERRDRVKLFLTVSFATLLFAAWIQSRLGL